MLWYTNSVLHLPRPEDWPMMPAHTAGFRLADQLLGVESYGAGEILTAPQKTTTLILGIF